MRGKLVERERHLVRRKSQIASAAVPYACTGQINANFEQNHFKVSVHYAAPTLYLMVSVYFCSGKLQNEIKFK